ncbi:MAG: RNA polymerase sigma factor [Bdellovibrionales bacterium]|nr:RNA polymerase sigma factor [Bdellovibrionales bacterium]
MKCDELSDAELVERVRTDPPYFECLILLFESRLRRYVLRLTGYSSSEIDDVLQESFILIYKNLNGYDSSLKLQSWVFRIVHNKSIDCLRKRHQTIRSLEDMPIEDIDSKEISDFLSGVTGEDFVFAKEKMQFVVSALDAFSEEAKEIFILRFWEGRDYKEISDILKKPIGTVSAILHRSKTEIVKEFRKRGLKNDE